MRKLIISFFIFNLTAWNIFGQAKGDSINKPGDLSLRIKSITFVKNNEYYNPVIEGYTMLGFMFQPELVYSPSEKISLRAGTHLLKYSGAGKFSQIRPVFAATLNITEKSALTIGTLSGSDRHQMFDPHFNSERLYNAYSEDGLQLTSKNDRFFNDTWVSWENYVFKGDSTQEILTFGESFKYTSLPVADFLRFEVPVQVQLKHYGGQISNYSSHVQTCFNLAAGLRVNIALGDKRYGEAAIEYLHFINSVFAGESVSGISHGHASWVRLHYTYKSLYFGASYWNGHDFYAPNGNTMYGSISEYKPGVVIQKRRLINNAASIRLFPESYVEFLLCFETYYNIDLKRLDNSATLHLNFDKLIRLATLRR